MNASVLTSNIRFFWAGTGRLVMPKGTTATAVTDPPAPDEKRDDEPDEHAPANKGKAGRGNDGGGRHPFIQGLLKELPDEGSDWGTAERVKWLKAAAMIFDLIYTNEDTGKPLKIEVSTNSPK